MSQQEVKQIYDKGMHDLVSDYADRYKADPVKYVAMWKRLTVPAKIIRDYYRKMLSEGLIPLGKLPRGRKLDLIKEAGETDNVEAICEMIYALQEFKAFYGTRGV